MLKISLLLEIKNHHRKRYQIQALMVLNFLFYEPFSKIFFDKINQLAHHENLTSNGERKKQFKRQTKVDRRRI